MIVVNFKTYHESTGENAINLARVCDQVAVKTGVPIVICPSALDIKAVRDEVRIDVYAQHVDQYEEGAHTGYITAANVRNAGADGVLLNHSEHRLDWNSLVMTTSKAKEQGLGVILISENVEFAKKELELFPNEVALEIPSLIAGNLSITKADPKIIKEAVRAVGENRLLVGSGIKDHEDVRLALELGAKGILISSGIVLSLNPYKQLLSLAEAFK